MHTAHSSQLTLTLNCGCIIELLKHGNQPILTMCKFHISAHKFLKFISNDKTEFTKIEDKIVNASDLN